MLNFSIVGSAESVRSGIIALLERTQADELMIVTAVHDPAARIRSYGLIAEAFGLAMAA